MEAETILNRLKSILKKHAKNFSHLSGVPLKAGEIEIEGIQEPYSISEKHSLVNCLKESMRALNISPRVKGSEGATVITFFQRKGIPAIATGFGVAGCAHIADEYVKISNLYRGTLALEKFLKIYQP